MKNINYPGRAYFDNAAKQIPWPIEYKDKQILVPQDQLTEAEENLMVSHFRSFGWHIQSVLPGSIESNKVYEPVMLLKNIQRKQGEQETGLKVGDRFQIKSTECQLEIEHIEKGKIHFRYINREKHNLIGSKDNLDRMLNMGYWLKVSHAA